MYAIKRKADKDRGITTFDKFVAPFHCGVELYHFAPVAVLLPDAACPYALNGSLWRINVAA